MKRSIVTKFLEHEFRQRGMCGDTPYALVAADQILNTLEKLGMLPPAHKAWVWKDGVGSKEMINVWEPEDEP